MITRHLPEEIELEVQYENQPLGAALIPPWPDAKIQFIQHESSWFYVYWTRVRQ